jgi:hypothetical protein
VLVSITSPLIRHEPKKNTVAVVAVSVLIRVYPWQRIRFLVCRHFMSHTGREAGRFVLDRKYDSI